MPTLTITLPKPHQAQRPILRESARFNVLDMGRRWGKSTLLQDVEIRPALEGYPVGWFAPNYKYLKEAWRNLGITLQPVMRRSNATDYRMDLITGGSLEFWTLEDVNAGRSRKYKRAVVDEAGLVKNLLDIWHAAIRPTLADYAGDAWIAGTPKGRNDFWHLWMMGQSVDHPDWRSWKLPTWTNPYIPASEIEAMRESMPALLFAQEVEAEFVEDALTLFKLDDIAAAEVGAIGEQPRIEGHSYVTCVDIGRRQDATIINTIDVTQEPYQRVAFDRLERVSYPVIQKAIEDRQRAYEGMLIVESNGVGDPVIENLTVQAVPFVTTAKSKVQGIQALQMLLEKGRIKAKWDARERAALISAAWDDNHTADEIMSLAIGAPSLTSAGQPLLLWGDE